MGKKKGREKRLKKEKFKNDFPTVDPDRFDIILPEDIKRLLRSVDLIKEQIRIDSYFETETDSDRAALLRRSKPWSDRFLGPGHPQGKPDYWSVQPFGFKDNPTKLEKTTSRVVHEMDNLERNDQTSYWTGLLYDKAKKQPSGDVPEMENRQYSYIQSRAITPSAPLYPDISSTQNAEDDLIVLGESPRGKSSIQNTPLPRIPVTQDEWRTLEQRSGKNALHSNDGKPDATNDGNASKKDGEQARQTGVHQGDLIDTIKSVVQDALRQFQNPSSDFQEAHTGDTGKSSDSAGSRDSVNLHKKVVRKSRTERDQSKKHLLMAAAGGDGGRRSSSSSSDSDGSRASRRPEDGMAPISKTGGGNGGKNGNAQHSCSFQEGNQHHRHHSVQGGNQDQRGDHRGNREHHSDHDGDRRRSRDHGDHGDRRGDSRRDESGHRDHRRGGGRRDGSDDRDHRRGGGRRGGGRDPGGDGPGGGGHGGS